MPANKKYILLFLLIPAILYTLPFLTFIPEITDDYIIGFSIFFLIITFIFCVYFIFRTWKSKKSWFILTTLSLLLYVLYFYSFLILFLQQKLDLCNNSIKDKRAVQKGYIYVTTKKGLLCADESEIGFSHTYSPLYKTIYKTEHSLEIVHIDAQQIQVEEFTYTAAADSVITLQTILHPKAPSKVFVKKINIPNVNL